VEPTEKQMSGKPTSMIGLCQEGKSSPAALRRSVGVKSLNLVWHCAKDRKGYSGRNASESVAARDFDVQKTLPSSVFEARSRRRHRVPRGSGIRRNPREQRASPKNSGIAEESGSAGVVAHPRQ